MWAAIADADAAAAAAAADRRAVVLQGHRLQTQPHAVQAPVLGAVQSGNWWPVFNSVVCRGGWGARRNSHRHRGGPG
jgi:hypothetical protein